MLDQDISKALEEKARAERMLEGENIPVEPGATGNFLDITALIRSIQLAEGNPDCFRRAEGHCEQTACGWHKYCLETHKAHFGNGKLP